jgi:hypothetical protein
VKNAIVIVHDDEENLCWVVGSRLTHDCCFSEDEGGVHFIGLKTSAFFKHSREGENAVTGVQPFDCTGTDIIEKAREVYEVVKNGR